jgi:hypothetical protein
MTAASADNPINLLKIPDRLAMGSITWKKAAYCMAREPKGRFEHRTRSSTERTAAVVIGQLAGGGAPIIELRPALGTATT